MSRIVVLTGNVAFKKFFSLHCMCHMHFFKVWNLGHIAKNLDLREEILCEAYASTLSSKSGATVLCRRGFFCVSPEAKLKLKGRPSRDMELSS